MKKFKKLLALLLTFSFILLPFGSTALAVVAPEDINPATNATINITADDAYELYVNGDLIGSDTTWTTVESYRVNLSGDYLIAVKAWDLHQVIAGLNLNIQFDDPSIDDVVAEQTVGKWQQKTNDIPADWKTNKTLNWGSVKNISDTRWSDGRVTGQWIWTEHYDYSKNNTDDIVYFRYEGKYRTNTMPVLTVSPQVVNIKAGRTVDIMAGVSATDAEDGALTVTSIGTVNTNLIGSTTIYYSAKDSDNNTVTGTRTVNVLSNQAPVLTVEPQVVKIKINTEYDVMSGVSATDHEDGTLVVLTSDTVDTSVLGTNTINYSVTDSDGNTSTATRTVEVLSNEIPILTINPSNVEIKVGDTYEIMTGVSATDEEDGELDVTSDGAYDSSIAGPYSITYTATDSDGNTVTGTRTLTVVTDTLPVLTIDPETVEIIVGTDYSITDGVSAFDQEDSTLEFEYTGEFDSETVGTYVITYSVTDSDDNTVTGTRTINVIADEAPVLTINPTSIQFVQGTVYDVMTGVSAVDKEDESLEITHTGEFNPNVVGAYTITYSVTDSGDNTATGTRTIIVTATPILQNPIPQVVSVQYTLNVSATEGGEITKNKGTSTFEAGTTVELGFIAKGGYEFTGWSGDTAAINGSNVVTLNSNVTLVAHFDLIKKSEDTTTVEDSKTPEGSPSETKGADSTTTILDAKTPEASPESTLPKTGGIPAELFYLLGSGVTALGLGMKKRQK